MALEEVDAKLVTKLLNKLLVLYRERDKLAEKHRWRLQLALGIPTLQMYKDALVASIVDAWLERRADIDANVAYHAKTSLHNITCLHEDHPLRKELNSRSSQMQFSIESRRRRG